MQKHAAKTLTLLAFLMLAGCSSMSLPHPTVGHAVAPGALWHCNGGRSIRTRLGSGGVAVTAAGHTYQLPHVAGGPGVRYAQGGVEYRELGGSSTLTGAAGGPYANCRH